MSEQYPGGYITKSPVVPTSSAAPGIWNLSQQATYKTAGTWPLVNPPDAQFNYVTMLLHGDGTNGAQNNTFLDSSTNNFTITRNGNTTQGSFSPYGSNWSNYFGETSSALAGYLSMPTGTALDLSSGNFTIEAWIFPTADVSYAGIFSNSSGNTSVALHVEAGSPYANSLKFHVGNGSTWQVNLSYNFPINQWYHVAATRNGNVYTLWVNGVSQASTTYTGSVGSPDSTSVIGRYYTGTNDYYYWGYISNLRVVKGTAVYTSTFTPSTTPLTAISGTSLLTCQSNRFVDNSASPITITVNRTPNVQRFNPFGTSTAYSTATIGGSGYFDGTEDYLTIADRTAFTVSSNSMTCEAWVYPISFATQASIFGRWNSSDSAQRNFLITIETSGVIRQYTYTSGAGLQATTSTATLKLNAWNHVAYVKSGDTNTTYINGVSAATATSSGEMPDITAAFSAGATSNGAIVIPSAYISDVRFLNGTALYSSTFTPPTAPLTSITNTVALLNMTNGAIYDNAMLNDLETVGNAQISTSVKKYGTGSMSFPTTGDYVSMLTAQNSSFGTGNFTVEGWMYFNTVGSDMTLFTGTTNGDVSIRIVSSQIRIGILGVSWDTASATQSFSTATWYHFAVVRSSGTITFYLNGTSIGSGANTAAYNVATTATIAQAGGGAHLDGYIDDLRITKGYARYTTTFTPPTAAFPNIGPT